MRSFLLFSLVAAGCSAANPCDGIAGMCVNLRVEGDVGMLDQLDIAMAVTGSSEPVVKSTSGTGTFSLPVRLAVVPPANAVTPLQIEAAGELSNQVKGQSPVTTVALGADEHASVTLTLAPVGNPGGDGGAGDLGGDGGGPPPGVVSFSPSTIDFGAVHRGATSPTQVTQLVNKTSHAVTITGTMGTGDTMQFDIDPHPTTCFSVPDGGMMGPPSIMLPAGGSCAIGLVFKPGQSGTLQAMFPQMVDDGEMPVLTLKGIATPSWSAEQINGVSPVYAVWASGSGDWWAVGSSAGSDIFRSDGKGNWNPASGSVSNTNCRAVYGIDANNVWFGCDNGVIYFSPTLSVQASAAPSMNGLWAVDANTVVAATAGSPPQMWKLQSGSWTSTTSAGGSGPMNGVCGSPHVVVAVGASGTWFYSTDTGSHWNLQPNVANYNLNGCWMADDQNVWIVGSTTSAGIPGEILHCTGASLGTCAVEEQAAGVLSGISGRSIPGGGIELYAVGSLGNVVLHSDGKGSWSTVQVPNNQAMLGVYTLPTGETMAVGFGGQVNHLY